MRGQAPDHGPLYDVDYNTDPPSVRRYVVTQDGRRSPKEPALFGGSMLRAVTWSALTVALVFGCGFVLWLLLRLVVR